MTSPPRLCVYTALYGDNDRLPEYSESVREGFAFIAFVGDPTLRSDTWTIRHLPPRFASDLPRSARFVKLQPHRLLADHDASIWVDCSVLLTQNPQAIFDALLLGQTETMAVFRHSMHADIGVEVEAVLTLDFDDPARILEQYESYAADGFTADAALIWTGVVLRFHHHPDVVALMDEWLAHVLRYSRRDQLALPYLLERAPFKPVVHALSNRHSAFHRWPVPERRVHAEWRATVVPPHGAMVEILALLRAPEALPLAELKRQLRRRDEAEAQLRETIAVIQARHAVAEAAWAAQLHGFETHAAQQKATLLSALQETRIACDAAMHEAHQALAASEQALRELSARETLLDQFRTAVATMQRSTSWRLTAPLRRLAALLS